jgi:hypothetical protein
MEGRGRIEAIMSPDPRDPRVDPDRDPVRPGDPPVRERIERRTIIHERPRGGGGAAFGVGALIVLLLVAVGAFLWWNSRHNAAGVGANPASMGTSGTSSGSYGTGSMTPGVDENQMATGAFGIAVGNYPDEQSAVNERQRLNTLTDQPVALSQTNENGAMQYRVVIGNFATRAQADSAGRTLASTLSLPSWEVVPIQ